MKKLMKLLMSRAVIVALLILFQLFFVCLAVFKFSRYIGAFYGIFSLIDFAVVCKIINTRENPSYKIAWIIPILALPPFGVAMYLIFRGNDLSRKLKQILANTYSLMSIPQARDTERLRDAFDDSAARRQSDYIKNSSGCPPYDGTHVEYYPSGEAFLPALLERLEQAEKYIFLEYFIIERGEMWDSIHEILRRKAKGGVDVRVIYDDMGCLGHLRSSFCRELNAEGIRCRVFNRFIPVLSARLNNRNHRKLCIVDGKYGFTGGLNLADEYINVTHPYGYWKDNAVELAGPAVASLAVMFLSMWDSLDLNELKHTRDYTEYLPERYETCSEDRGIVQPYTDNPLDDSPVGESVYLNMIYAATDYIWISTPYLIIDYSMERALCSAAESGVDVRIVVPGIPDKRIVNEATKSNYPVLIVSGVKIYEYEKGFNHAKTFVCDDKYATVGTVNLDFRSLYLHFECGVWMYKCPTVADIKEDMSCIFEESRPISADTCHVGLAKRLLRGIIELFAPLF